MKITRDGQLFDTEKARLMLDLDGSWQENSDGTYTQAIPLPFYGLKKRCQCGTSFWKEENYRKHYAQEHTDGKSYRRDVKGFHLIN